MISAMNFKSFDRGALCGFFDLRYHAMDVKAYRLMESNGGQGIALSQRVSDSGGERRCKR